MFDCTKCGQQDIPDGYKDTYEGKVVCSSCCDLLLEQRADEDVQPEEECWACKNTSFCYDHRC